MRLAMLQKLPDAGCAKHTLIQPRVIGLLIQLTTVTAMMLQIAIAIPRRLAGAAHHSNAKTQTLPGMKQLRREFILASTVPLREAVQQRGFALKYPTVLR
jgi:hypothetical protein